MKKIDFHAHYLSPEFVKHLDTKYQGLGDGIATPNWSVDSELRLMKKLNIEYSFLSISSPQVGSDDLEYTNKLALAVNKFGQNFTNEHPDELGYMASLPLPFIKASCHMVSVALNDLSAKGFSLPTNSCGLYLGDSHLDPVMEELNKAKSLVAIHPVEPNPINTRINTNLPVPLMEFFFDTTRAIVNMAEHQIFTRYPEITWIIPHAGSVLPIIAPRISSGTKNLKVSGERDGLIDVLNNTYFDTAGLSVNYQLDSLLKIADPSKILYGSDTPYTNSTAIKQMADDLEQTEIISSTDKQNIFYNNAKNLISLRKN